MKFFKDNSKVISIGIVGGLAAAALLQMVPRFRFYFRKKPAYQPILYVPEEIEVEPEPRKAIELHQQLLSVIARKGATPEVIWQCAKDIFSYFVSRDRAIHDKFINEKIRKKHVEINLYVKILAKLEQQLYEEKLILQREVQNIPKKLGLSPEQVKTIKDHLDQFKKQELNSLSQFKEIAEKYVYRKAEIADKQEQMVGKSLKNLASESKSTIKSSDLLNTIIDNIVFESDNDFQKYHYEITRTLNQQHFRDELSDSQQILNAILDLLATKHLN